MRTSGRAFLRRFRSQASSSSRDNSAAVMAHHSRSPYASVAVAPAERRSAGRGGTSAAIPMRRRPPRLGSPPGPPLRGDPSNQSVSPGGEPIGPRRDWGGCGKPRFLFVLVTWPGTVKALSCPANPGRRIGRIPDSAGSAPALADSRLVAREASRPGSRAEPRKVRAGENPRPGGAPTLGGRHQRVKSPSGLSDGLSSESTPGRNRVTLLRAD
jgi:hypothetical protein